jgi:hypothetical protein
MNEWQQMMKELHNRMSKEQKKLARIVPGGKDRSYDTYSASGSLTDSVVAVEWNKNGGHPNTVLDKTYAKAMTAGFRFVDRKTTAVPDGSTISGSRVYMDDAGNVLSIYTKYGATAYDNTFSVRLQFANQTDEQGDAR